MRTKTLLLTAALAVAGLSSASAQVYSVNAVGYINLSLPKGFSMICSQLKASPDNQIKNVLGLGSRVFTAYVYQPATGDYAINGYDGAGGYDDETQIINPGVGVFIQNPSSTLLPITLVGEVPQGTLVTPLSKGFNLVGSQVPQAGLLGTTLGYTPSATAQGDIFYRYNNATGQYDTYSYDPGAGYDPEEPNMNVAESLFIFRTQSGAGQTWSRTFTVN
jgi:hypothetical protein